MPRPCPIKATRSMWCELITIIDATKAGRHRGLLQAKENKQENRFHLLANRTTFGIAISKWGSDRVVFCFFLQALVYDLL